jgi:hypothetical protein
MKKESGGLALHMNKEQRGASSILTEATGLIPALRSPFSLKFLEDGQVTVRDELVGETFHPVIGAMNEARQLYVAQTFLQNCWKDPSTRQKTVWDVGFGAGANALAAAESWCQGGHGDLTMESFDTGWEALSFALKHKREHAQSFGYLEGWDWEKIMREEGLVIRKGDRSFSWKFHLGDFAGLCLKPGLNRPDLVMYDLYSAPKCPALYSLGHWERMRERLGDHASLVVLHTRSTVVRVTLSLAGWYIGTGTRLGDKEETTLAASQPGLLKEPLGTGWLGKVQRSTSACPILDEKTDKGPILPEWFERLKRHPQWHC